MTETVVEERTERTRDWHRVGRFGVVSVMNVVITQALLQGAYQLTSMGAVAANVFAVGVSSLPAYLVNRRWVWQRTGRHSVSREIVPFWTYSFVGLALSTVAVAAIEDRWSSPAAVSGANIGAFAVLWIAKYVFLDRWLFTHTDGDAATAADATGSDRPSAGSITG